jgi:23S rRNA (guanosine2251-2'-O)-methyltransferase
VGVARERHDHRVQRIIDECRRLGIAVRFVPRQDIDRLAGTASHQGVAAVASAKTYADVNDILDRKRGTHALVLVLDGVEDPHNLGAIIRTADGAGADGVLIPERRAAGVTATVAKASAGAVEHVPIAKIPNVGRALEELKSRNIWTVGLDERGPQPYDALDYNMDCALVLGAEGKGLHELVRKKCDFLVSIPMLGKVPSLNVSVAAAVVLYEIARQRRRKTDSTPAGQDGRERPLRSESSKSE